MRIPEGLDWDVWRVVSSDKIRAGLIEVQTQWSLSDLLDAHITLDLLQEAAELARKQNT